jgi:ribonuclease D
LFDEESNVVLLGFCFAHDMTKLRPFCDYCASPCLDVQRLAAQEMNLYKKELLGLQACAANFLSRNYILSKQEQCSDWARRPLMEAQLEYAGLDAAVLLVLLAEIASEQLKKK